MLFAWLIGWLVDWSIAQLTDWLTDLLTDWLTDWLTETTNPANQLTNQTKPTQSTNHWMAMSRYAYLTKSAIFGDCKTHAFKKLVWLLLSKGNKLTRWRSIDWRPSFSLSRGTMMFQWPESALVQAMACYLVDSKPVPKPVMTLCQLIC